MVNKLQIGFLCIVLMLVCLGSLTAQHILSENIKVKKRSIHFPKKTEIVSSLPSKENLWIFLMAGQSNMAGRGFVSPEDTIPNPRILTFTKDNQWTMAKEPLHYYQPNLMGLDCGISFAKELLKHVDDSVHIALVPCAMGGTSIRQWRGDSIRKNIRLYSNLKQKGDLAKKSGEIKGVLWHQGESDAKEGRISDYQKDFIDLMKSFRNYFQNESLPIIVGELGNNLQNRKDQKNRDAINQILRNVSDNDTYMNLVSTRDFTTHDGYHFDSRSLRIMGIRYAQKVMAFYNK